MADVARLVGCESPSSRENPFFFSRSRSCRLATAVRYANYTPAWHDIIMILSLQLTCKDNAVCASGGGETA